SVVGSSTIASGRRYQARSASPPNRAAPEKTSTTSHRSRSRGRASHPSQPASQPNAPASSSSSGVTGGDQVQRADATSGGGVSSSARRTDGARGSRRR